MDLHIASLAGDSTLPGSNSAVLVTSSLSRLASKRGGHTRTANNQRRLIRPSAGWAPQLLMRVLPVQALISHFRRSHWVRRYSLAVATTKHRSSQVNRRALADRACKYIGEACHRQMIQLAHTRTRPSPSPREFVVWYRWEPARWSSRRLRPSAPSSLNASSLVLSSPSA